MRRVSGEKLPSKQAVVSMFLKSVAREESEDSGLVEGGGAAVKLHHSRKEKGSAGLR